MTGFLNINNIDAYTAYGVIVKQGNYGKLLKLPDLADNGLTEHFADQSGDDEYLLNPKFEASTISLPFAIHASSENDFYNKYLAFRNVLLGGGEMNWDFLQLNGGTRFKLSYRSMSDYNMLTTIKNSTNIIAEFTLTLKNNHPTTLFEIQ